MKCLLQKFNNMQFLEMGSNVAIVIMLAAFAISVFARVMVLMGK